MEPFDIHDPAHSPRAGATEEERFAQSSSGAAFKGHLDMTGRITGTLTVRGKTFQVDAIERMDRSWGLRPEAIIAMNSINATFGEDLAFHFRAPRDLDAPGRAPTAVAHGYALDKGRMYGVERGSYTATRMGVALLTLDATLTDIRGKTFRLHTASDVGAPWTAYAGVVCWNSMMKWTTG